MDPCVPGISLENARAHVRIKLSVPSKYANKMTVSGICKAVKLCKNTNIMPPMDYRQFKGKMYLIDPKSPLSIKDFLLLLGKSSTDDIKRIAKSVGLVTLSVTKSELVSSIIKILQTLNISEPIEIPLKLQKNMSQITGNRNNSVNAGNRNNSVNAGNRNNSVNTGNGGNTGNMGPESGEMPYNENVAPHLKLIARPSKVRINKSSSWSPSSWSPSENISLNPKPSNVSLTPITQARINQSLKLAKNLQKRLGGNESESMNTPPSPSPSPSSY